VETLQHKTKAKRDKYGRFLAVLYSDLGDLRANLPPKTLAVESINAKMITEGHAKERYW
jgi:endonuclease YncB( thermonuclease family)